MSNLFSVLIFCYLIRSTAVKVTSFYWPTDYRRASAISRLSHGCTAAKWLEKQDETGHVGCPGATNHRASWWPFPMEREMGDPGENIGRLLEKITARMYIKLSKWFSLGKLLIILLGVAIGKGNMGYNAPLRNFGLLLYKNYFTDLDKILLLDLAWWMINYIGFRSLYKREWSTIPPRDCQESVDHLCGS